MDKRIALALTLIVGDYRSRHEAARDRLEHDLRTTRALLKQVQRMPNPGMASHYGAHIQHLLKRIEQQARQVAIAEEALEGLREELSVTKGRADGTRDA